MTVEFVLLCHATTRAMKTGLFPTADDPIEPVAEPDAIRRSINATRVLTSPARAARDTAAWLSAAPELNDAFDDLDHGRWRGRSVRDVHDEDPEGLAAWLSDPQSAAHGGESLETLGERVWRELTTLAADKPQATIIVTHAIVLKVALARVLNAPLDSVYAMDFEPLSTLTIRRSGQRWRILQRTAA